MSILTERDERLLQTLGKYGFLSSSQIARTVFPSIQDSTMLRRLRVLEKDNWIYRVTGLESGELVWCLTMKGREQACCEDQRLRPNRNGLAHDVLLTDLRMRLESIGLGENFVPEWSIRQRTYRHDRGLSEHRNLIPDGIFSALFSDEAVRVVALELEIQPKSIARYEKIFEKYMAPGSLSLIWYFVKTRSFGAALFSKWRHVAKRKYCKDEHLVYSILSEFQANPTGANIYFMRGDPRPVADLFRLPRPAHTPAQRVGRAGDEKPDGVQAEIAHQNEEITPTAPNKEAEPSTADPSPPTML